MRQPKVSITEYKQKSQHDIKVQQQLLFIYLKINDIIIIKSVYWPVAYSEIATIYSLWRNYYQLSHSCNGCVTTYCNMQLSKKIK